MVDLTTNWVTSDLETLIASKDDSITRQIVVDVSGNVYIHDGIFTGACHTQFEAFYKDTKHLGLEASKDPIWVGRIEAALRENWPVATSKYLDVF